MYRKKDASPDPFAPRYWHQSSDYLYGVDLYNFGYYWEAHEAWEGIWKTTQRVNRPGRFLQGLIQVSAALLKREQGITGGMESLGKAGLEKLRGVAGYGPLYCGLNLPEYVVRMGRILGETISSKRPLDPAIDLIIPVTASQGQSDQGPG